MSHGSLICRECFIEVDPEIMSEGSDTGLVCPNCQSDSVGI
jgi:hypothetical protein